MRANTEAKENTEYQRGLNDGLEQAARICEDVPYVCIKGDESAVCNEACAEAIRAQIKK